MVSERNKETLQTLKKDMARYKAVGIVDMNKLPARQLLEIRGNLKGKALIRMAKKRVTALALKESGLESLSVYKAAIPALLFSDESPFKLARVIAGAKSSAPAKAGDILEKDITIPSGSTGIAAGPAIGEFQRLKIPVGVENGKISVKKDTVVARKGGAVTPEFASLFQKLGINPVEIGLNLLAVCEGGTVYPKDVLFVPPEYYPNLLKEGYKNAFALTLSIGHVTRDNVELLLSKAHGEARSLAMKTGFVTEDTLLLLLAKGAREAETLKRKAELPEKTEAAEGKEETKAEEKEEEKKEETSEEKTGVKMKPTVKAGKRGAKPAGKEAKHKEKEKA
jgi:large subunit ribosomal protein L10